MDISDLIRLGWELAKPALPHISIAGTVVAYFSWLKRRKLRIDKTEILIEGYSARRVEKILAQINKESLKASQKRQEVQGIKRLK